MRIYIIISLLFFSLCDPIFAQTKENKSINWLTFEQLSDSLNVHPKKVLLFFHTDWCSYCKKMMKETFMNQAIVDKINQEYYAVHFDAESIETVQFDNAIFEHPNKQKIRGKYHPIATLLMPQKQAIFPTIMILDGDFKVKNVTQKYLSSHNFNKIL